MTGGRVAPREVPGNRGGEPYRQRSRQARRPHPQRPTPASHAGLDDDLEIATAPASRMASACPPLSSLRASVRASAAACCVSLPDTPAQLHRRCRPRPGARGCREVPDPQGFRRAASRRGPFVPALAGPGSGGVRARQASSAVIDLEPDMSTKPGIDLLEATVRARNGSALATARNRRRPRPASAASYRRRPRAPAARARPARRPVPEVEHHRAGVTMPDERRHRRPAAPVRSSATRDSGRRSWPDASMARALRSSAADCNGC